MDLIDPSKITTWISLSAAALTLIAFIAKLVVNSEAIKRVTKQHTFDVLKSVVNKTFYLALVIVILSAVVSLFDSYVNNAMKTAAENAKKSQQLLQEWSLLEEDDKEAALNSLRNAAVNFSSHENYFMYASALSNMQKYQDALIFFEKAIELKETKEAYLNKGVVEQKLGLFDKAIKSFEHGLNLKNNSFNENIFQSKLNFNLASTYLDVFQSQMEQAPDPENLNKAELYLIEADRGIYQNSQYKGSLYGINGLLHELKKNYAESARFYEKSLRIRKQIFFGSESARDIAVTSNNISSLLLKEPFISKSENSLAIKEAQKYAEEANYIFQNGNFELEIGFSEFNLAEAYRKLGEIELALVFYKKSKASFLSAGLSQYEEKIASRIIDLNIDK